MTQFSMSHSTRRSILIAAAVAAVAIGFLAPMAWQKQERPPAVVPLDLSRGAVRG